MAFLYGTQLKSHRQIHTKYFIKSEDHSIEKKMLDSPENTLFLVCDEKISLKEPNSEKTMEFVWECLFCEEAFTKKSDFEEHHENHLTYNDLMNKIILAWIDWLQLKLLFAMSNTTFFHIIISQRIVDPV